MKKLTQKVLPVLVAAACSPAMAAPDFTSNDAITIYSKMQPGAVSPDLYRPTPGRHHQGTVPGYAIVRHDRTYELNEGLQSLRVSNVAALIDPTTVTFNSMDEPDTRVLEQSFRFDLVSQAKLLQRYLGQRLAVEQIRADKVDTLEGTLLSANDGLLLQMDDGSVQAVRSYGNIHFPDLPGGLITRPTLEWQIDSPSDGVQNTRIAYETGGMTWWADYNIIYDESRQCLMDLSAWVSIINQSGSSYDNARLKLIAGDVNRAEPVRHRRDVVMKMAMAEDSASFSEKAFFEYHMYTLDRRTDLPDNSTSQLQLMPSVKGVHCEKRLVFAPTLNTPYYGYQQFDQEYGKYQDADVAVYLGFRNEADNGLGVPLPAGRIRVNQLDESDGSLEFIGEDVLDHTPRDENVLIRMGNAFDVIGERKQTDFQVDLRNRWLRETFEIRLRNHKDEDVSVEVLENLYRGANWELENVSLAFEKESSNQVSFDVQVASGEESVLTYTAYYHW